jgi:hypothetical protein
VLCPWTPSQSQSDDAWGWRARARMYLSTAAADFLPIGTQVSSPPLRRIRSRRCARKTSFADSSSGSYRSPARPDTRSPVSIKMRMIAVSRRSTNVAPEHIFRSRASSSSVKNVFAFLVTFGASTRSIGFGFSRSPSLASQPKNARMLRKWTAADAADVRCSSASRNARTCGASTSSMEAGMSWFARNRQNARTESVYERTVRELLAAASSASCHEAMNVLSAGPEVTVVRRARLRLASRMLVTDELASDDMGSSRSPVRTAPAMPYP